MIKLRLGRLSVLALYIISLLPMLGLQPTSSVYASGCDDLFYRNNNILYYSPEGCDDVCDESTLGTILGGSSLPEASVSYLDSLGVKDIAANNRSIYNTGSKASGIPWRALAAIHYREAEMQSGLSLIDGSELGGGISEDGIEIAEDAEEDAKNAAKRLVDLARDVYDIDLSSNDSLAVRDWGRAFLAYDMARLYKENGKTYDQSPYVANGFDDNHLNMKWLGGIDEQTGNDTLAVGALTVFRYLGGSLGETDEVTDCVGAGIARGNIVQTALGLSINKKVSAGLIGESDANPAYISARKQYGTTAGVTDCGGFVSIVMRASESDSKFPIVGTDVILEYMMESSKYSQSGYDTILPGDIIIHSSGTRGTDYKGHVMIFTGKVTGSDGVEYVAADANLGSTVPGLEKYGAVLYMQDQTNNSVWRFNG